MLTDQYIDLTRSDTIILSNAGKNIGKLLNVIKDKTQITRLCFNQHNLKHSNLLNVLPTLLHIDTLIIDTIHNFNQSVLFETILHIKTVKKIHFRAFYKFRYDDFSEHLKKSKTLKSLCIHINDDENVKFIIDALCVNNTLQSLNLKLGGNISNQGLTCLKNMLAVNNTLQRFKICLAAQYSNFCFDKIRLGLIKNKSIKIFILRVLMCSKNIKYMYDIISLNKTIQSYDLKSCRLPYGDNDCEGCVDTYPDDNIIINALVESLQSGRAIEYFSMYPGAHVDLTNLSNCLLTNNTLTNINLNGSIVSVQSLQLFFASICENSTLETLHMHSVNLKQLVPNIVQVITKNSSLTDFDISNSSIYETGYIFDAVRTNTSLKILAVDNNRIGTNFDILTTMLSENSSLVRLSMKNFGLSCEMLTKISQGLGLNESLTSLNVSNNNISKSSVNSFVADLYETNFTLVDLTLSERHNDKLLEYLERNISIQSTKKFKTKVCSDALERM